MKRRWSIPLAAIMSMLLMASAAAEDCTPVPPKKWEGKITYGGGGWVGGTVFNEAGCSWSGADGLNGTDTIVWDVEGYGGATASITSTEAVPHHGLQGYFLNENCERGGSWGITERDTPYSVGIPEGAKWIVIYQQYGGYDTTVTMETNGIVCEEVEEPKPPKKKKKKPKRN
jgi:hypothetical protein